MSAWGQATDLILLSLQALGRGTHWTVADEAELPAETVRKTLQRMADAPLAKRKVHIVEWTLHADGRRNYWRQVYAFGSGPNRAKPQPLGHTASARRWAQRCQVVASQMLGRPVTQNSALPLVAAARRAGAPL